MLFSILRLLVSALLATLVLAGPAGAQSDATEAPTAAVDVYRWAAETGTCSIPWSVLAGIGDFASDHGRGEGESQLQDDGVAQPALLGPVLDGTDGVHTILDTDDGELDGNTVYDRAVGPFQFVPNTWLAWGADGNGDGLTDPQNIWDAARSAESLLCAYGVVTSPEAAVSMYYGTGAFVTEVLSRGAAVATAAQSTRRSGAPDILWAVAPETEGMIELTPITAAEGGTDASEASLVRPVPDPEPRSRPAVVFGVFGDDGGLWPATVDTSDGSPLVGDWDGDGVDELGRVELGRSGQARFVLSENDESSVVEVAVPPNGTVFLQWVTGDWNGDGLDSPGWVDVRTNSVEFRTFDGAGRPYGQLVRVVAAAGVAPITGDWDGDGVDTLGLFQAGQSESSLTVLDRLGAVVDQVPLAPASAGSVAVGPEPRPAPDELLDPETSQQASYIGSATTETGTELNLWKVKGIVVDESIAAQVLTLLAVAETDGISLGGWGYRTHAGQIRLRTANCPDVWSSPANSCSPATAIPGTSRHEFGVAIDFTSGGSVLTSSSPEFAWLEENAARYGLENLPSEPWHWSVDGG